MPITVLIKRKFKPDHMREAFDMIIKLRSLSTLEPGYISGQTMVKLDDPTTLIVMSTWDSIQRWEDWKNNDLRQDYANKMEKISEGPETHEILTVLV
jgi:quinol monooxygenase YgiN